VEYSLVINFRLDYALKTSPSPLKIRVTNAHSRPKFGDIFTLTGGKLYFRIKLKVD